MGLEIYVPKPVEVTVDGRALAILPVKFRDAQAFAEASAAGDVIGTTAVGTGVERAWLEELPASAVAELYGIVLETNADFFVQMARIGEITGRVRGRLTLGATSSPSSDPSDTTSTAPST
jgi:hypothetical protein